MVEQTDEDYIVLQEQSICSCWLSVNYFTNTSQILEYFALLVVVV